MGEGRYQLLSSLGFGGFAEVFLAEGPQGLVAVKVVETAAWSEREYRVFNALMVSEASFLSTLQHPALPKLRAFFAEASRYFLVMDWVRGQTLEELVGSEGPLALPEAFRLLEQSLAVLGYLHDECRPSVVFGDFKPANLLRTFRGAYRLVDLGLAAHEGVSLTREFAVYSPPYSAPERATGEASVKSHDIYSLSATVAYALTGTASGSRVEPALRQLFDHCCGRLDPTAAKRLGQLLTLLLAGLHPDPGARPDTLEPLRQALQRFHEGSAPRG